MKIITITPSPAYDLHLSMDTLAVGGYNTASILRRDSAGKGINLSRALAANGIDSLAALFLGRASAEDFLSPPRALGMRLLPILTEGSVRENINIHTGDGETVIATGGPAVTAEHIREAEAALLPLVDSEAYVVLSGSISPTSDKMAILAMLYSFKAKGARLILDTRSLTLEEIIALRPYLIKPNGAEAEALTGLSVRDIPGGISAALAIRDMGCEGVLLTLGGDGAVLAVKEGVYTAASPRVEVRSTVGAGDSTVAGYLASLSLGEQSAALNLARAVAFGSAACMEEGSAPPRPEVVEELLSKISPSRLA